MCSKCLRSIEKIKYIAPSVIFLAPVFFSPRSKFFDVLYYKHNYTIDGNRYCTVNDVNL